MESETLTENPRGSFISFLECVQTMGKLAKERATLDKFLHFSIVSVEEGDGDNTGLSTICLADLVLFVGL